METKTIGYGPCIGSIFAFVAVSEIKFGGAGARDGM